MCLRGFQLCRYGLGIYKLSGSSLFEGGRLRMAPYWYLKPVGSHDAILNASLSPGQLKPTKAVADEARKELRGQNGISNKQGRSRLKPKPKVGAAASGWQGTKPRGGLRKQVWKIV